MKISRITTNGRITIPKDIRNKHGLYPGTRVIFIEENDEIKIVRLATSKEIRTNIGILGTDGKLLKSLLKDKKEEREL